jgi:23S rRNA pseudouridine2605 synthase
MIPRRLSKRLADSTTLSHQAILAAIQAGRVCVSGAVADDWDTLVMPEDEVRLDGEVITHRPASVWAMLHKPAGVVSTRHEPTGQPTLAPWLDALGQGVFPVGRLDAETTGLLLLTDDGDLSYMLLRPHFHVTKEYHLRLRAPLEPEDPRLARLIAGVDIGDGKHPACALSVRLIEPTLVAVELGEGRNRQVRKMSRAVRLGLDQLHRARFGPLELGELASGQTRALSEEEVARLWDAVGGRARSTERAVVALARQAAALREAGTPHLRLESWLEQRADG